MLDVITYNLQRKTDAEGVGSTIDAVHLLQKTYPNALLCLQEISPEVAWSFERIHRIVGDDNMIIAPEGGGLLSKSNIPGENWFRPLLSCQLFFQKQVFNVVTGKLPHGISLSAFFGRRSTFSRLLDIYPSKGLIMALDTNAYSIHEQEYLIQSARHRGLLTTNNPEGTYDLRFLESATILHKLARWVARIIPFCPELDFIFYDSWLRCEENRTIDVPNISDHKPVLARFN